MQTDKAKGSQENSQPSELEQKLVEITAPIQQALLKLQENQQAASQAKEADANAERKADLAAAADLKTMLANVGDGADDSEDKYDKLSNRQLIDVICTAMDSAQAANREQAKDELAATLKGGTEKLDRIEKVIYGVVAGLGMGEARKKFKDFDQFEDGIKAAIKKNPLLDFDDAYYIAKSKAAGDVPPKTDVDTERPEDFASVPSALAGGVVPDAGALAISAARGSAARMGSETKHGIVGFRTMVNAATEKVLSSRK